MGHRRWCYQFHGYYLLCTMIRAVDALSRSLIEHNVS